MIKSIFIKSSDRNIRESIDKRLIKIILSCIIAYLCLIASQMIIQAGILIYVFFQKSNAIKSKVYFNMNEQIKSICSKPMVNIFIALTLIGLVLLIIKYYEKDQADISKLNIKAILYQYIKGFFLGGILIGLAALGIAASGVLTKANSVTWGQYSISAILMFGLMWLFQGASEEILFRGFLMKSIFKNSNLFVAVILNSSIFSLVHIFNNSIGAISIINLFLFGISASMLAISAKSIGAACAFHSAWNMFQSNIFGFMVSGKIDANQSILRVVNNHNNIINGGGFGPEGGLAVSGIMLICVFIQLSVYRSKALKAAKLNLN